MRHKHLLDLDREAAPRVRVREWRYTKSRRLVFPKGAHARVEVSWVHSGEVEYRVGAQRLVVPAGSAVLVPASYEHQTILSGPIRASSVRIEPELLSAMGDSMPTLHRPERMEPHLLQAAQQISRLGEAIRQEAEQPGPGDQLVVEALSEALAVLILRGEASRSPAVGAPSRPVRAAIELMNARYTESLTVDDLAHAASMSRFHFSRRFREEVGQSPYEYLLRLRLARAAALLQRRGCSVTEAALSVGFNDVSRFSRMFRRTYGVVPSVHARHRAAGQAND